MAPVAELPLVGAGGEPVDFARTIVSHGVAELPPNVVDLAGRTLVTTLPVPGGARTVRISAARERLRIDAVAGRVGAKARAALIETIAHMSAWTRTSPASTRSSARTETCPGVRPAPAGSCARRPCSRTS